MSHGRHVQTKEIAMEHLQQKLAEADGAIAEARSAEEEAKVNILLPDIIANKKHPPMAILFCCCIGVGCNRQ